jgi:DNA-binding NarL/FixJ family response regulator
MINTCWHLQRLAEEIVESKVRVFIFCSNRLLRESISRILLKKQDLDLEGAEAPGPRFQEQVAHAQADVIVLDSVQLLADHAAARCEALESSRSRRYVLVAMADDPQLFLAAVRSGALGYVLQEASADDVVAAIRGVSHGEAVCPSKLARLLFDYVASQANDLPNGRTQAQLGLTRREQQLVPMIGRGLTNKEIAGHLNLSEQTVKNHIHRILRKVGVDGRLEIQEACHAQTFGARSTN